MISSMDGNRILTDWDICQGFFHGRLPTIFHLDLGKEASGNQSCSVWEHLCEGKAVGGGSDAEPHLLL